MIKMQDIVEGVKQCNIRSRHGPPLPILNFEWDLYITLVFQGLFPRLCRQGQEIPYREIRFAKKLSRIGQNAVITEKNRTIALLPDNGLLLVASYAVKPFSL